MNTTLAILFADICGSTSLYSRLGDQVARDIITSALAVMLREATDRQGTLIKTIGDELMCTFPTAVDAYDAAVSMQRTMAESSFGPRRHTLQIRIGLNMGPVILEQCDVHGDTVNVAARITSVTRARQILVTRAVEEQLPPDRRCRLRQIQRAPLRGKSDELDIFQVQWDENDHLATRAGDPAMRRSACASRKLLVRRGAVEMLLGESRRSIVLGRDAGCDIVVQSHCASRRHASIELGHLAFVLRDHSSNGTFLRFGESQESSLFNEQIALPPSGVIRLGEAAAASPCDEIAFLQL